jgi:aryl-alcohol dehydrogenase-like predicted oxidoreductase
MTQITANDNKFTGKVAFITGAGSGIDRAQDLRVIRDAHERGVTFFDTAEVYGPYVNEELAGQALASVRDKVAIATRFGFKIDGTNGLDSRPERIRKVIKELLKRLKTGRIEIYGGRMDARQMAQIGQD